MAAIVSPNDSSTAVDAKSQMWLEAGVHLAMVVNPEVKTVRVYRSTPQIKVLHLGDTFDAGDVIGGWKLKIDKVFS